MSPAIYHAIRLKSGQDLKKTLLDWARSENKNACAIVTCVGSLRFAELRLADGKTGTRFPGPHEIVSLVGTFSEASGHFHISLSDSSGQVVGGHLLEGCLIHTTAEIVIAELCNLQFHREPDPTTGYLELFIKMNELP